jgi:hypothetical protein
MTCDVRSMTTEDVAIAMDRMNSNIKNCKIDITHKEGRWYVLGETKQWKFDSTGFGKGIHGVTDVFISFFPDKSLVRFDGRLTDQKHIEMYNSWLMDYGYAGKSRINDFLKNKDLMPDEILVKTESTQAQPSQLKLTILFVLVIFMIGPIALIPFLDMPYKVISLIFGMSVAGYTGYRLAAN